MSDKIFNIVSDALHSYQQEILAKVEQIRAEENAWPYDILLQGEREEIIQNKAFNNALDQVIKSISESEVGK